MRQWSEADKQRQAELIKNWQPWRQSTGPSEGGVRQSSQNALKYGAYSAEMKAIRRYFAQCREVLKQARMYVAYQRARASYLKEEIMLLAQSTEMNTGEGCVAGNANIQYPDDV